MRNKKGQFIHNKWKNWRIWTISLSILFCLTTAHYSNIEYKYVAEKEQAFMVPIIVEPEPTVEDKIKQHFPKSYKTMIAVAKAESGLDHSQQNWNCWYNKDRTIVYPEKVKGSHSTSCKKEHRKYSWSMDCGLLMKNYIGVKECPEVDIDTHLEEMAELSKKRGFTPWYAWSNGSYLAYMK